MSVMTRSLAAVALVSVLACGSDGGFVPGPSPLRFNELVSNNEGVAIDEFGETEDIIELINVSDERLWLNEYQLRDGDTVAPLPMLPLEPGELVLFYADSEPDEGEMHLPFNVSSGGETLELLDAAGHVLVALSVPSLGENESLSRFPDGEGSFARCRFASPGRANGEQCGAPELPPINVEPFAEFDWPDDYGQQPAALHISELALRQDAPFVELFNTSDEAISLETHHLLIAAFAPHRPWPSSTARAGR